MFENWIAGNNLSKENVLVMGTTIVGEDAAKKYGLRFVNAQATKDIDEIRLREFPEIVGLLKQTGPAIQKEPPQKI